MNENEDKKSVIIGISAGVVLFVMAIALCIYTLCIYDTSKHEMSNIEEEQPEKIQLTNEQIVGEFFLYYQKKDPDWFKSFDGHKRLKKSFEKKITTDLEFAKACASYGLHNFVSEAIRDSETISSYSRQSGEEGEVKAFDFVIPVHLIKPMYNGQQDVEVKYEIISTIPSTVKDHKKPYIQNVNYCGKFESFLKNEYDATLNLGCFILTNKEKKDQ